MVPRLGAEEGGELRQRFQLGLYPGPLGSSAVFFKPHAPTTGPKRLPGALIVGIGGAQTGIYPRESPGGWRLIGRTASKLFDSAQEPPALLAPGDRVRFVAVDGPA